MSAGPVCSRAGEVGEDTPVADDPAITAPEIEVESPDIRMNWIRVGKPRTHRACDPPPLAHGPVRVGAQRLANLLARSKEELPPRPDGSGQALIGEDARADEAGEAPGEARAIAGRNQCPSRVGDLHNLREPLIAGGVVDSQPAFSTAAAGLARLAVHQICETVECGKARQLVPGEGDVWGMARRGLQVSPPSAENQMAVALRAKV